MKSINYFKKYTFTSLMAPLFKILEALFELLVPLVIADIVDIGIKNNDIQFIQKKGLILLVFALLGFICTIIAQYFASKVAVEYCSDLRSNLFNHIQKISNEDYQKLSPSSIIIRLTNDTNQVQNGLNLALRLLLRSPVIVFGAFIMAARISLKLSITFLITIIILLIIVFTIMLVSIPLFSKIQNNQDTLAKQTKENIVGIRAIRAFNHQDEEIDQFSANNEKLYKSQIFANRITALLNPLTYLIINVGIIVVLYQCSIQVNIGTLTSGQSLALYNYMSQILVELIKLANLIIQINKALACIKRIDKVFEIEEKPEKTREIPANLNNELIKFNDVSFKYPNSQKDSLENLDFTIEKGSITGIIGPTGSGKSSIVSLLNNFYPVTSGEILISGININDINENNLHSFISTAFQKSILLEGTVQSNLKFSKENSTKEEMLKSLENAQCDFVKGEKDLDKPISQFGNNLSGGQKQRLSIARALIKDSEVLVLDDCTSALDYVTEKKIREMLLKMKGQKTIIIISQRISSISFADKIILLEDGKVSGIGNHKQLLENNSLYQEIYSSQNKGESNHE